MRTPPGIGFTPGQMSTFRVLVHLPNFIKLYSRLFKDKRIGMHAKFVLLLGVAYVLMPLDLIANFLIPFGWIDDIIVMYVAANVFVKLCPQRVVDEHVEIIDQGG